MTHRPLPLAAAVLAASGLLSGAHAQPAWETRIRYRLNGLDTIAPGDTLPLSAPGTYTVIVQVGIFNLTGLQPGQSNQGLFEWNARLVASGLDTAAGETLGVTATNARITPFVFGPATTFGGFVTAGGTVIEGTAAIPGSSVHAARDVAGGATAPCAWDSACGCWQTPTAPVNVGHGAAAYANVYRFRVTINSLDGPDVVITPFGSAGPVLRWVLLGLCNCDEDMPCAHVFLGLTPSPPLQEYARQSLRLSRCPLHVTQAPASQNAQSGQVVWFTLAASAPQPMHIQWRRDGEPLVDDGRVSGAQTPTLTIAPVRASDQGVFDAVLAVSCINVTTAAAVLSVVCRVDYDGDGDVLPADLAAFINTWFRSRLLGTLAGDFNGDGAVDPADVAAFIGAWLDAVIHGC